MTAFPDSRDADTVLTHVIGILQEITSDWDVGTISSDTRLADLNLESINLVYFIAELQQQYGLQQRLFTRIRSTDRAVAELTVGDVVQLVQDIRHAREAVREDATS